MTKFSEYFPPGMREQGQSLKKLLGWANEEMNPVNVTGRMMEDGRDLVAPGKTGWERTQSFGEMMTGVAELSAGPLASKAANLPYDDILRAVAGRSQAADDLVNAKWADEAGGIRTWHGSPHDFDKFDSSKIGTGEGAQAYGHGLYSAESPEVALSYQRALSDDVFRMGDTDYAIPPRSGILTREIRDAMGLEDVDADYTREVYDALSNARFSRSNPLDEFDEIASATVKELEDDIAAATGADYKRLTTEFLGKEKERLANLRAKMVENDISPFEHAGSLYELNINANAEDFLDYDRVLENQSEKIKNAAASLGYPDPTGANEVYDAALLDMLNSPAGTKTPPLPVQPRNPSGSELLTAVGETRLREAGIPGIKYLDEGSRYRKIGRDAGSTKASDLVDYTSNYVTFDDRLIDILSKNGEKNSKGVAQEVLDLLKAGDGAKVTDDMLSAADDSYLFNNYDLPMDEASRMARNWLPDDQFHATNTDFYAFKPSQTGLTGRGVYTGDYADEVEDFAVGRGADGSMTIPLVVPPDSSYATKMQWEDALPEHMENVYPASKGDVDRVVGGFKDAADDLAQQGFSGVRNGPGQRNTFDPANIRSRFARFDPRLKHLRNLSAGGAGITLGTLLANPDENHTKLREYLSGI